MTKKSLTLWKVTIKIYLLRNLISVLDNISMKHVTIHPTYRTDGNTLTYHEVRFLKQIIRIYFRNEIEISHFIRIGENT